MTNDEVFDLNKIIRKTQTMTTILITDTDPWS